MSYNKPDVIIFGCKSTTKILINQIKRFVNIEMLITVDDDTVRRNDIADYCNLEEYCKINKINIYKVKDYSLRADEDFRNIENRASKIGFVMGWQRLIPNKILSLFKIGIFGMHGSSLDLPKGRGRSPMNWSIIEGRKIFYTNLFKYDDGVDSGKILGTYKFQITERDTAETMHYKNTLAMGALIKENIDNIANDNIKLISQSKIYKPSYYPKRSPEDSLINLTLDVYSVDRFIRAVAPPFNGAFCYINESKIIITSAQVFDMMDFSFKNALVGEIVAIFSNDKFLVKCFGGLLLVNKFTFNNIIKVGDVLGISDKEINVFPTNNNGEFHV